MSTQRTLLADTPVFSLAMLTSLQVHGRDSRKGVCYVVFITFAGHYGAQG